MKNNIKKIIIHVLTWAGFVFMLMIVPGILLVNSWNDSGFTATALKLIYIGCILGSGWFYFAILTAINNYIQYRQRLLERSQQKLIS